MTYRAFSVGNDGHFIAADFIDAETDEAAVRAANALVRDGVGIELWHLARQVAVLPHDERSAA